MMVLQLSFAFKLVTSFPPCRVRLESLMMVSRLSSKEKMVITSESITSLKRDPLGVFILKCLWFLDATFGPFRITSICD